MKTECSSCAYWLSPTDLDHRDLWWRWSRSTGRFIGVCGYHSNHRRGAIDCSDTGSCRKHESFNGHWSLTYDDRGARPEGQVPSWEGATNA